MRQAGRIAGALVLLLIGFSRDVCWLYGSMSDGVSWKVSTPNVCSTTLPTSLEIGPASARVARAFRMSVCV